MKSFAFASILIIACMGCTKPTQPTQPTQSIQKRIKVLKTFEFNKAASGMYHSDNSLNIASIRERCLSLGFNKPGLIDRLLFDGITVISRSEFVDPVMVEKQWTTYLGGTFDLQIAGNCKGIEYILEGNKKTLNNI